MKKIILLLITLSVIFSSLEAQETRRERRMAREKAKNEEVYRLFQERDLRFLAQMAIPMGSTPIYLTSEYTLDINNDSVSSFLPYYGVAYSAGYGGDGGIKFSEIARKITWKESKKGFDIVMEVRSPKDLYNLRLSIQPTGYATLMVSSNNRQSIHFSGLIVKRKTN